MGIYGFIMHLIFRLVMNSFNEFAVLIDLLFPCINMLNNNNNDSRLGPAIKEQACS